MTVGRRDAPYNRTMSTALYQQIVLEHYRHPRNRGQLDGCTHAADGVNASCGDALRVELECTADARVAAMRFSGEACAIAIATASMLSERIAGVDAAGVGDLMRRFERVIADGGDDATLGPLNALGELQRHPARRKCALLPWAALRAALAGEGHISTEQSTEGS